MPCFGAWDSITITIKLATLRQGYGMSLQIHTNNPGHPLASGPQSLKDTKEQGSGTSIWSFLGMLRTKVLSNRVPSALGTQGLTVSDAKSIRHTSNYCQDQKSTKTYIFLHGCRNASR